VRAILRAAATIVARLACSDATARTVAPSCRTVELVLWLSSMYVLVDVLTSLHDVRPTVRLGHMTAVGSFLGFLVLPVARAPT
jgi:hypothetical protein